MVRKSALEMVVICGGARSAIVGHIFISNLKLAVLAPFPSDAGRHVRRDHLNRSQKPSRITTISRVDFRTTIVTRHKRVERVTSNK